MSYPLCVCRQDGLMTDFEGLRRRGVPYNVSTQATKGRRTFDPVTGRLVNKERTNKGVVESPDR